MQAKRIAWLAVSMLLTIGLASCNLGRSPEPTPDVGAIYTSAAGTTIAQLNDQLTQTAQAAPTETPVSPTELPTLPPVPTLVVPTGLAPFGTPATAFAVFTPGGSTPGPVATLGSTAVGCADAAFVADMTIPDGTAEKAGALFTKIWRLQNTGSCNWGRGFVFAFAYGSKMGGNNTTIASDGDIVTPGNTKDFGTKLLAPAVPNTYTGCWRPQTPGGYFFGQVACVTIKVSK